MINKSTIAPIVLGYQVAEVSFHNKDLVVQDRSYFYKLPTKDAAVGDYAVVKVNSNGSERFEVVVIKEIHDAGVLDIDSSHEFKWVLATFNFDAVKKAEEIEAKLIEDIDRKRQQDVKTSVMAQLMLSETDVAALTKQAFD